MIWGYHYFWKHPYVSSNCNYQRSEGDTVSVLKGNTRKKYIPVINRKCFYSTIITSKNGTYWKFLKHSHYRNRTISTNFDFASLSKCQKETVCWWETIINITVMNDKVLIWTFVRSERRKKDWKNQICLHKQKCTRYYDFIFSISSDLKRYIWVFLVIFQGVQYTCLPGYLGSVHT